MYTLQKKDQMETKCQNPQKNSMPKMRLQESAFASLFQVPDFGIQFYIHNKIQTFSRLKFLLVASENICLMAVFSSACFIIHACHTKLPPHPLWSQVLYPHHKSILLCL